MSIAVIGGVAVAVFLSIGGNSTNATGGAQITTVKNAVTPQGAPSLAAAAAAAAACRTSYQAVQAAVDEFEYDTGTGATNISELRGFLHDPVATPQYTITIDRSLAGEIDVATPGHPASPGDANCAYAGP